jgi:triosephosphate isomerase
VKAVRPLVAGNWKMNGKTASLAELGTLLDRLKRDSVPGADIIICPPATLLAQARYALRGSQVGLGAQDCHPLASGAHTGDIAAEMLKDAGAEAVIVGHSERRADHGETDDLVRTKAEAAHRAGLTAIICIGETERERKSGKTLKVVGGQLEASLPSNANATNTVIAYEPVWAIGTGLTPSAGDIAEVHGFIRQGLAQHLGKDVGARTRILYGGSVKPANARELLLIPDVNGALVGGASLSADDFYAIIATYA